MKEILKTYHHVMNDFITSASIINLKKKNNLLDEKRDETRATS